MHILVAFITILLLTPITAAGVTPPSWNLQAVRADQAPRPNGENTILVAVLDSGVYMDAEALSETLFEPGWNFVDRSPDTRDDNGHGTHIASLVAGRTGANQPLCSECVILPVKVLDSRGLGDARTLASGIRYAVERGADVINMSMGFDPGYEPGKSLAEAVAYARERGVVMVASVGNEGRSGATYPASYPGVIAVAAVDYDGRRTRYSNVVPAVDVAAPGGDDKDRDGDGVPESILSDGLTQHGGVGAEPWLYSGTSQAAAHVSALAARLLARGVPPEHVEAVMAATARDVGPEGFDVGTGAGLVDFAAALERADGAGEEIWPLPWDQKFQHLLSALPDRQVEVQVLLEAQPAPGVLVYGHWKGTRRVIVRRTDRDGRFSIPVEGARPLDFQVDRILSTGSELGAEAFLTARARPYEGIVASPLSRFPR